MKSVVKEIAVEDIRVSKSNPRKHFDPDKIRDLQKSIIEKGIIEPVIVRTFNGKYEMVCGARRLQAARKAGLKTVPSIVRKLTDKEALEFQVIENLHREDIHPLEEAEGYEVLLKKHGYRTADDLAVKIGKSRSYIYGRIKLCDLISENRQLFYKGKFSPSVAMLVARIPKDLQKEAGKIIARGGQYEYNEPMSYRKAHEYISKTFMLQLRKAPFDTKDKTLCAKAGPCAICQKRTGNQKELFPDIQSADVCTDPGCFAIKIKAFTQRTIERAKAAGKKVLSLEESKKVFPYEHITTPQNKYVSLDETCYELPKYPKYRELIKRVKDAPVVYAVHPFKNSLIEMIEKTEVPKLFKKIGLKLRKDNSNSYGDPQALKKAKAKNRVREAKRGFWIDKVSAARNRRCMNVVVLDILLDNIGVGEANAILKLKSKDQWRSWDIPKLYELGDEAIQKFIVKVISKKSEYLQDDDLEFLSTKLGFNIAKEYVITETYLRARTKDQLITLAKEIGLMKYLEQKKICEMLGDKKKTELIDFFLKKGFKLEEKVPKEIAKG